MNLRSGPWQRIGSLDHIQADKQEHGKRIVPVRELEDSVPMQLASVQ